MDDIEREQEAAAAREAAEIGGPGAPTEGDEESRPVEEAGGGEAEGFEQAERELEEHATHAENRRDPEQDAFTPEGESDRATAEYAEPDEVDPTEVTSDPENPDDPGEGTPIAPDR